jgi:hypothetical protein
MNIPQPTKALYSVHEPECFSSGEHLPTIYLPAMFCGGPPELHASLLACNSIENAEKVI